MQSLEWYQQHRASLKPPFLIDGLQLILTPSINACVLIDYDIKNNTRILSGSRS